MHPLEQKILLVMKLQLILLWSDYSDLKLE